MIYDLAYNRNNNFNPLQAFDEATYYGKNKNLLECESLLEKALELSHKNKYRSDKFINYIDQVGDILAKTFGFESVEINNSVILFNPFLLLNLATTSGCSLIHSTIYKYTKILIGQNETYVLDLDTEHKGVQFSPKCKYVMRMFLGMELFMDFGPNGSLTASEILAIILHEIGHNFYVGPIHEIGYELFTMMTAPDILAYVYNSINILISQEIQYIIDNFIPDNAKKAITKIYNTVSGIFALTTDSIKIVGYVVFIMYIVLNITKELILIPKKLVGALAKYDSEKYSDAFATSYGYGTELATALYKLSNIRTEDYMLESTKTFSEYLFMIYGIPLNVFLYITDSHPNTSGRLANDIAYMRSAGKSIRNPRIKKEYDNELAKMEKLRKSIKDYEGPSPIKNVEKFRSIVQDLTHISDLKDIASGLRPKITKYINLDK